MSPKPLTFSLSFSITHFSFLDSQRSYYSAGDELIGAHEWETKPPESIRDELELTWFSLTCQIDFPVLDLLFNGDNTDSTHFLSYSCTCFFCFWNLLFEVRCVSTVSGGGENVRESEIYELSSMI